MRKDDLPVLDLPQMDSEYNIDENDISVGGGVFVRLLPYPDVAIGDYIEVLWDGVVVKEYVINDLATEFPKVLIITQRLAVGEHEIYYTVQDQIGNISTSSIITVYIKLGEDVVYSPPIYSDIENNIIDQTSLDENAGTHILVEPYVDMSLTDIVSVFWSCLDSDGNIINTIVEAKGVVLENFTKGIEYFISKKDFKNVKDGTCSAYYQVRRGDEIQGISNKAQAVIQLEGSSGGSDNLDLIITTGATITDYDAIHVYPFNVGVIKGQAGKKITLFATGSDTIFEESDSNILQTNLDENGKSSFRIWSKSTGGVLVTAQETDQLDISVSQSIEFGVYAPGIGNVLYINHSTGAPADGYTPCSIYLKTANSSRLDITQVHVVVSGSAVIAGYGTNTANILLNSDKSVEINVVNNYAENIEVEISLPESSGSINRLTVFFVDF